MGLELSFLTLCAVFPGVLSPSRLILQRCPQAVRRRCPLASKVGPHHLSLCSVLRGSLASLSVFQLRYPSPGKRPALGLVGNWGSCASLGDRHLPALTWSTGHRDLERTQTGGCSSCLPLEGRGEGSGSTWNAHFHSHFRPHLWSMSPLSKQLL